MSWGRRLHLSRRGKWIAGSGAGVIGLGAILMATLGGGGPKGSIDQPKLRWTERTATVKFPSPNARIQPILIYDPTRHRWVMFGGLTTPNNTLDDTWEYDGRTWAQITVDATPPHRRFSAATFDTLRNRVIMFGGKQEPGFISLDDTWAYDGTTWTQLVGSATPIARTFHTIAYDISRDRVVLMDGAGPVFEDVRDLWEFDGTNWSQKTRDATPQALAPTLAYDVGRQEVIAHGGTTGEPLYTRIAETWAWNGTTWTDKNPVTVPSNAELAALSYLPSRGRLLRFGGIGTGSVVLNETWSWDGTDWRRIATVDPQPTITQQLTLMCGRSLCIGIEITGTTPTKHWVLRPGR